MAVTAISAEIIASQEDLGDLKLYRIPEPVTVAANSQKQVAFLARPNVRVGFVYRGSVARTDIAEHDSFAMRYLVTRNREDEGLGLAAAGRAPDSVRVRANARSCLAKARSYDAAIGEDVEIYLSRRRRRPHAAASANRDAASSTPSATSVTNDQAQPIRFEALFQEYQRSVRSQTSPFPASRPPVVDHYRSRQRHGDAALSTAQRRRLVPLHRPRPVILVERDEGEQAFGHLDLVACRGRGWR